MKRFVHPSINGVPISRRHKHSHCYKFTYKNVISLKHPSTVGIVFGFFDVMKSKSSRFTWSPDRSSKPLTIISF